ncbi:uncharacterized protein F4812DRAFT_21696 [Daldinia caldariorum]|uniref:uncharacterized protein n=1 Tax=Daldinia caldariorum TaxID=326644 RepID=UPI0020073572|nr:uncharacterized protein F4812DRAFT_21696 [Daldinia caldariorum]KAI1472692.1 hypothetical protein F4812DRAFT_21696 [Daldinia caldariorum]
MPLRKSFSELNTSSKTRQQWSKTRSHSTVARAARNPVSKPLQPISEVTKNKLNAFKRSDPTKPDDHEAGASTVSTEATLNADTNSKVEVEETANVPAPKESTTPPSNRLAWHDLIGTAETEKEEEGSPNEKIGWDTKEDIQHRLRLSPVMPGKRGKKRARSSSPVSSPASHSKYRVPAVNVEKLSRALKSPHADPALELWDRFSQNGSATVAPLGVMNSTLAQIMVSSSPRPSRVAGEGGLRRAISCGENWPKRRRVERTEAAKPAEINVDESPSRSSKSSMVNALLQSVTGELNRSKAIQACQDAPESPLHKKKSSQPVTQIPSSPTRRMSFSGPSPVFALKAITTENSGSEETLVGNSSDYDDEDFDDDALMELGVSIGESCGEPIKELAVPPADTGQDQKQLDQKLESFDDDDDDDDEFNDMDDDDIFAVAGDLITQIDETHTPPQPRATTPQKIPIPISDDLAEDIYGDDFGGDFDFDAAEMAATQSVSFEQMDGSLPVRWR